MEITFFLRLRVFRGRGGMRVECESIFFGASVQLCGCSARARGERTRACRAPPNSRFILGGEVVMGRNTGVGLIDRLGR